MNFSRPTTNDFAQKTYLPCFIRRVSAALLALLMTVTGATAHAQVQCVFDFMDIKYELHEVPPTLEFSQQAVNTAGENSTQVGFFGSARKIAATFNIYGGPSELATQSGLELSEITESKTLGISDNGVAVGYVNERAFRFTNQAGFGFFGFQYLSDAYPVLSEFEQLFTNANGNEIQGYTQAISVNTEGTILIRTLNQSSGAAELYMINSQGALSSVSNTECAEITTNDSGEFPPNGELASGTDGDYCAEFNAHINNAGEYVGWKTNEDDDNYRPTRGGASFGSENLKAYSINDDGFIGATAYTVFSTDLTAYNLSTAIAEQCDPAGLLNTYSAEPLENFSTKVFINDEQWITADTFTAIPACPDIDFDVTGAGLVFQDGKFAVTLGETVAVTTTIYNYGAGALDNPSVQQFTGVNTYFDLVSGPTPALPAKIEGDSSFAVTYTYRAKAIGEYSGGVTVKGTSACGYFELSQPNPTTTLILPADGDIIVNSATDLPRESGATSCDTGNTVTINENSVPECTLRAAIQQVNADGMGSIKFAIPGSSVPRISPATALPDITAPVVLDGTTQPASKVELFGGNKNFVGLDVRGGNSFISGLVVNGFVGDQATGIVLSEKGNNSVFGNFIGTDVTGTTAKPNETGIGILPGSDNNLIGGDGDAARNVIAASSEINLFIASNSNNVRNNYIGTNKTGQTELYGSSSTISSIGILLAGDDNTVGGATTARRNVIVSDDFGIIAVPRRRESTNVLFVPERNRLEGNFVGLLKDGSQQSQGPVNAVAITGGNDNRVTGNHISSKSVASKEAIAVLVAYYENNLSTSGTRIESNRIGLNSSGTTSSNTDTCVQIGSVDLAVDFDSALESPPTGGSVTGTIVRENNIAGCGTSISVRTQDVTGTQITNNQIGLRFDDSDQLPQGNTQTLEYGIRVDGSPNTMISQNKVSGHLFNIALSGSLQVGESGYNDPDSTEDESEFSAEGFMVSGNTIGLNGQFSVPAGADQRKGLSVFGTPGSVTLSNNTIAGHSEEEIWLKNGNGHAVTGNRIGTTTGNDHGSNIGVLVSDSEMATIGGSELAQRNIIGRNSSAGIELRPGVDTRIENNLIGTDVGSTSAWPNQTGILANSGGTSGLVIESNRISGNNIAGVLVANLGSNEVVLINNRIGTGTNGTELPNSIGVSALNTQISMKSNTVAFNEEEGIFIDGDDQESALIENGPIYENNGPGILYAFPPHAPLEILVGRSEPDANDNVILFFGANPSEDVNGSMELYGNTDCSNPQGRVPLLQRPIFYNEASKRPFFAALSVPADSALATLNGFTATLTLGNSTSVFSPCVNSTELVDSDMDGVIDFVENLGPNMGDADQNSEPDSQEPNIATVVVDIEEFINGETPDPDSGETQIVTIIAPPGATLSDVVWNEFASGLDLQPAEGETRTIAELPHGLISFEVNLPLGSEGAQAEITIGLAPVPANHNYIKIPNPAVPNEYVVLPDSGDGDRAEIIDGIGWVLTLTDGGAYDSDGMANGIISDPGGPAVLSEPFVEPPPPVSNNARGGSGGCTVGNGETADPLLLIAALLSLLGIYRKQLIRRVTRFK